MDFISATLVDLLCQWRKNCSGLDILILISLHRYAPSISAWKNCRTKRELWWQHLANSQHKPQTLHEFNRGRAILERTMVKTSSGDPLLFWSFDSTHSRAWFSDSVSRHALRYAVDGLAVKATIKRLADLNCQGDKSDACAGVCDVLCF